MSVDSEVGRACDVGIDEPCVNVLGDVRSGARALSGELERIAVAKGYADACGGGGDVGIVVGGERNIGIVASLDVGVGDGGLKDFVFVGGADAREGDGGGELRARGDVSHACDGGFCGGV